MAELLAKHSSSQIQLNYGDQITGNVVSITDHEIVLDLGAKSEGILNRNELSSDELTKLKIGDKLICFVMACDSELGQVHLSLTKPIAHFKSGRLNQKQEAEAKIWQKYAQLKNKKSLLKGKVTEVNKGGLIIEVEGLSSGRQNLRGFLPVSQIGFKLLNLASQKGGWENLTGEEITVTVIEVDQENRRLIFTNREEINPELKQKLALYQANQKITAKIVSIAPYGLILDLDGIEGFIHIQEISWEKTEDLSKLFKIGQEIEAIITNVDEQSGKVNLSIRKLAKDPFEEKVANFQTDDVIRGTILDISQTGVTIQLKDGIEGFIPAEKMEQGVNYNLGEEMNFLVDNIDKQKRKINLAPFITSTVGLIYK